MKLSTIFDRLLLYKNVKIILLIVYPILILIIYLNWNDLYNLWFEYFMRINQKFEEPTSIVLLICYWYYTFYGVFFLFYPLLIFDKKHENCDKIKFYFPKLNRENSVKIIKDVFLFIVSPVLLILGFMIFTIFLLVSDIFVSFWVFLGLISITILMLCILGYYLYKIIKSVFQP
jgi:hypothetical protein